MAWKSKTGQFNQSEINRMEQLSAQDLRGAIMASAPLVGLRLLAELKLNGAQTKLTELLANEPLKERVRRYTRDLEVTADDRKYAKELQL